MKKIFLFLKKFLNKFLKIFQKSPEKILKKQSETFVKNAAKILEKNQTEKKFEKYPKFIPFYEWHGFLKGLQSENRKYVLSGGKIGIKPKRWK